MNEPKQIVSAQNRLGETPIWEPEENALYWVDWGGLPTCRLEPDTGKFTTYPTTLPSQLWRVELRVDGSPLLRMDCLIGNRKPMNISFIYGPAQPDKPEICYNDAAVDRLGRLLVSTVNMNDPFLPEGSLYRLDPDYSLHELDTGYATANGIGLSPDGKTIYVADQRHRQIIVLDYDTVKGTTNNRRVFAHIPDKEGMPDGLIVDAEGFIWNGHWDGWKLTRYDPDGKIEREIRFPVQHVISFAFGGKDLDELFITTASWDFEEEQRKQQPWAGDLFRVETGVKGLVEPAFAG